MKTLADAVLLDAALDVDAARRKVLDSRLDRVVVRRREGLVVFWYVFPAAKVIEAFQRHDPRVSVKQALSLHEHGASPVDDGGRRRPQDPAKETIVLDGTRFLGIRPPEADATDDTPEAESRDDSADFSALWPGGGDSWDPKTAAHMAMRIDNAETHVAQPPKSRPLTRDVFPGEPITPATASASTAFTAYPRLDTPDTVSSGETFRIRVGLGRQAQTDTTGGRLELALPDELQAFELDLLVVAEGFAMPDGCRHRLPVDRGNSEAKTVELTLVAPDVAGDACLSTISVFYFFAALPCGHAARRIAVLPDGRPPLRETHGSGTPWFEERDTGGAIRIDPDVPAADLTVIVSKPDGNPAGGQYVWSFASPHPVDLPPLPIVANLGTDARDLGSRIIEGVQKAETLEMVGLKIGGLGRNIAEKMPGQFWPLLAAVAEKVATGSPDRRPSVLFITAETHVPWELAKMATPLSDDAPPYLGCQVDIGRWPLNDSGNPGLSPSSGIDVRRMAVVVGDYAARSGWRKLDSAEQEGTSIAARHRGLRMQAAPADIKNLLYARIPDGGGAHGAEAVHFACHGEAIGAHPLDAAVILEDGQHLDPDYLTDSPLGARFRPFLFLNACQVGKAGELLGSFSGFAGESLKGGFRAFLAPLWSVDDRIAHDIAIEFYNRAFGEPGTAPEPVAAVLRDLRSRFNPDQEKNSATRLAYVFYGHPGLTLHRTQEN
ncbi:MAG TPA: CHAT domain-containing protein [Accumulibacter sp.]|jgi:hypothetical protein|nr:CHAT domain-containing protein [Accumulibacter sp.]HQC81578.1 CHAT domain-containing protein [Accumulibacter sp.]